MIDVDQVLKNTALIAAIAAAIGWALNKGYDVGSSRLQAARARRNAIVRFYIDSRLRYRSVAGLLQPDKLNDLRQRIEHTISAHHAAGHKFRMYGVQVVDPRAQDEISDYLTRFPPDLAELVLEVILLDRTMVALYDKMQSDAFEGLTASRQIEAVDQWIGTMESLAPKLSAMLARIEPLFHLGQALVRPQSDNGGRIGPMDVVPRDADR